MTIGLSWQNLLSRGDITIQHDGLSLDDYLVQLSKEGLEKRLELLFPDEAERDKQRPDYYKRLEFETGTIIKMGFPGYFLIVSDFIKWAKTHGIPVGPGRGSGAGSLVAFSLGITDLDPLRYALLFERFHKSDKSRSEDKDGYGLGLYIVKTILQQHKEEINVTSENGVTTFTFSLRVE